MPTPLNIKIIYEDDHIIVVDKPAGAPSHMLKPDETGTVVNFLLRHYPAVAGVGGNLLQSGLAHRLDTDTSGVLLAVKDTRSFNIIRNQFKQLKILKEYSTLIHNRYTGPKIISTYIAPDPKSKKKVKVYSTPVKGSRRAVTEIVSRKLLQQQNFSLLTVRIQTGYRHQIRAHLAWFGNPVVGDLLYQNLKTKTKPQLGLQRHFLHASRLGFNHPSTGQWLEFTSPLPRELKTVLNLLQ